MRSERTIKMTRAVSTRDHRGSCVGKASEFLDCVGVVVQGAGEAEREADRRALASGMD